MKNINLFIIDAINKCNLSCHYCYAKPNIESQKKTKILSGKDLSTLFLEIKKMYDIGKISSYNFVWPGGEPLLLGISYFKEAFKKQKEILGERTQILNQINTNATFINKEWISFFEDHNVDVIVGVDGPDETSNKYRIYREGYNASKKILEGIQLIKRSNLDLKILTVITNDNYEDYKKLYSFSKEYCVTTVDYLPCYDCNNIVPVSNENYYHFMKNIYNLWKNDVDETKPKSITLLSSIIKSLKENETTCCTLQQNCGGRLYFNSNGDIRYCCNGMFNEKLLSLGNIYDGELSDLLKEESHYTSLIERIENSQQNCKNCEIFEICGGGCSTQKTISNGFFSDLTYYCRARYWLIKYIYEDLLKTEILAFDFGLLPNNPKLYCLT